MLYTLRERFKRPRRTNISPEERAARRRHPSYPKQWGPGDAVWWDGDVWIMRSDRTWMDSAMCAPEWDYPPEDAVSLVRGGFLATRTIL